MKARSWLKFLWKLWIFLFGMLMGYSLAITILAFKDGVDVHAYVWVAVFSIGAVIGALWCLLLMARLARTRCMCQWLDAFNQYDMNIGN